MSKRISQREAHRLRRQVREMEAAKQAMLRHWSREYIGVQIGTEPNVTATNMSAIRTALRLRHVVLVKPCEGPGDLSFHAVRVP